MPGAEAGGIARPLRPRMIARFDAKEHDRVPEWMKDRIRATDIGQLKDWLRTLPDWNWSSRQALAEVATPALFLVGELEDEADTMAELARLMPHAERYRVPGQGDINAFLRSDLVLLRLREFLSAHAWS
jgi:hypothetical protein